MVTEQEGWEYLHFAQLFWLYHVLVVAIIEIHYKMHVCKSASSTTFTGAQLHICLSGGKACQESAFHIEMLTTHCDYAQ